MLRTEICIQVHGYLNKNVKNTTRKYFDWTYFKSLNISMFISCCKDLKDLHCKHCQILSVLQLDFVADLKWRMC